MAAFPKSKQYLKIFDEFGQRTAPGDKMADFKVTSPLLKAPVYTFDHEPTIAEMRETAVRVMHDMLSVQWFTPSGFKYRKTGAVAGKLFQFEKEHLYGGLPYTNAQMTLFEFMEFIDPVTGALNEEKIMREVSPEALEPLHEIEWDFDPVEAHVALGLSANRMVGNTCTGSTGWALAAVCNSVRGGMISYTLVPKNGFFPVGDYEIPADINNTYEDTTTFKIMEKAGREKMYACMAQVLPADLVDENDENPSTGHSMMAIEPAHTVYREDGSIDDEESYILIQDQRAGFYDDFGPAGESMQTSGRRGWKASFKYLFDHGYMPVTTAEFLGRKPYEQPAAGLRDGKTVEKFEDLYGAFVESNFAMAWVKTFLTDSEGRKTQVHWEPMNRTDIDKERAFHYPLADVTEKVKENLKAGETYRLTVELCQCNGAHFTPVDFTFTA